MLQRSDAREEAGSTSPRLCSERRPPSLTVIRARSRVELPPRPDMERVRFEHEQFNRSIAVYSTDPFFASAMVDARMMEWLRNNLDGVQLELSDRWAVVWFLPHRGRRLGPQDLLDILSGFDERIPRALPSLFPERRGHVMWRERRGSARR